LSSPVALEKPAVATLGVRRPGQQALLTAGLAGILCALAFAGQGGLSIGRTTPLEMGLIVAGGLAVAGAVVLAPRPEHLWGVAPLALLLALAALTALSITWAANPSAAWVEANRTLAYAAVFAAAVALAHALPGRWSAVVGAITLCSVFVSAYAVLTKVFPATLNPDEVFARLNEPFGYWNSVGLMAASGIPGALWLGSRRLGHQGFNALAYPAVGLLALTIVLSYSRGALAAAVIGVAFWFATVPLRLRGAAVLLVGTTGGTLVVAWALAQDALTADRVALELQTQAGHQQGLLLIAMLGLLTLAGLAVNFALATRRIGAHARDRIGVGLLVALALVPAVGIGLAATGKGLGGSLASTWTTLTDPDASIPPNDVSRLTAVGSARARYWDEALKIFSDRPVSGVGADGYATVRKRYRKARQGVRHAHGYVVQTLADLGLAGLLVSLALAGAWLVSALRAVGLRRRRDRSADGGPERIGLLTLFAIVLVFVVHSLVDWTWFVPANAVVALVAAGWVAGRGPLDRGAGSGSPAPRASRGLQAGAGSPSPGATDPIAQRLRAGLRDRPRAIAAAAITLIALVAAWTVWQPLRSDSAVQSASASLDDGDIDGARAQARSARDRNPLSLDPLFALNVVEYAAGRNFAARRALEDAVRLQPANPQAWLQLAEFELNELKRPAVALTAIRPALYLDPLSADAVAVFLAAKRRASSP